MKILSQCLVAFFFLYNTFQMANADVGERSGTRGARKLFGGYRITPKFCKATRTPVNPPGGPNICMFNHECTIRSGEVVGACMDGFLFGACCQLPSDSMIGDVLFPDYQGVTSVDTLSSKIIPTTHRTTPTYLDITSNGVSQIAASLLGGSPPFSGNDNSIQVQSGDTKWTTTGIMYTGADTEIDDNDNEISGYFSSTKGSSEQTTSRYSDTYPPPILQISVSNAPIGYTPLPTIQRPMFRPKPPKPTDENYVLVPTLTAKPNKTEDIDSKITASTTNRPLSTFSFVSSSLSTTRKPPSTSYVASSTIPSRRTTTTRITTTRTKKPTRKTTTKYSVTTSKPPSTSYVYSTTKPRPRPSSPSQNNVYTSTEARPVQSSSVRPITVAHSTFANSPEAFPGSFSSTPSYSYVSGSSTNAYRPATVSSSIAGPGFTVTSQPVNQYSPFPSPAPTVIVLGPASQDSSGDSIVVSAPGATEPTRLERPTLSQLPQKKPVNVVTINNHVTQNLYSTPRPQTSSSSSTQNLPSPTVIITPKPTISSSYAPLSDEDLEGVVVTSANDLINFPPDRNPNLNLSVPILTDDDITTPSFVEDDAMNEKVESFVNQIIYGLQEPFNDLKDIVYNKQFNATEVPTKKPVKKQGSTTKKPISVKTTTRRPVTTKKPAKPIRAQTTTTKKPVTTGRPVTTVQSFIDTETEAQQSYRDQCGVRPLLRSGRIVGGKGAVFGEFPWQVLVRESTWLGLFTKNKCGGVLISDKYVITAAHCQPGFLASLVAVFGEYDISGNLESRKPVSRNVKRVIVHRKYDPATFENDLALLELESPVKFDAHIIPICLPPDNMDYTKRMATVTGWGRLKYGGGVPSVLQEVQVPIMENHVCQEMFRTAGHSKVILESFLCAGYANGLKDACEGDSGGPLVVQRPDGRYELAGTVSHGIKCAAPFLPGVYMRTTYYKPWIIGITGIE
ncbi:serine protease filzig isoform X2 [Anthonomus grandis grandis]|uniref:serine protease filzig isoform X2 n=1 Tax=Anthonomus grandis grandis TaxID=2921223 RepID=UPI002166AF5D|nr:serine protease filzig isoform X2 [Anthonomus grandis grandis]